MDLSGHIAMVGWTVWNLLGDPDLNNAICGQLLKTHLFLHGFVLLSSFVMFVLFCVGELFW